MAFLDLHFYSEVLGMNVPLNVVLPRKIDGYTWKTPTEILTMNAAARTVVMKKLCDSGVELICTDGIIIDPDSKIGAGTKILPGTIIRGETVIGENSVIAGNTFVTYSVPANTKVASSQPELKLKNRN